MIAAHQLAFYLKVNAHDRAVEQRKVGTFGGDVEVSASVGRFEVDGQDLARFYAQTVLRGELAFDRVGALDGIRVVLEIDLFDTRRDLGGGAATR